MVYIVYIYCSNKSSILTGISVFLNSLVLSLILSIMPSENLQQWISQQNRKCKVYHKARKINGKCTVTSALTMHFTHHFL